MARPRDDRITDAVLASTRQLLAEVGYRGLTLEGVAAHAQTTKPAIRRRWPSLKYVVVEAMTRDNPSMAEPDTGCVQCDLVLLVEDLRRLMGEAMLGRLLPALIVDLADDDELRDRFATSVLEPRRRMADRVFERGVARGELRPDLDLDLAQDQLAGAIVYRFLFAHALLAAEESEQLVDSVLRGLAATAAECGGRSAATTGQEPIPPTRTHHHP